MPRATRDNRLHVVHLLYSLDLGGVERQLVTLAQHLPRERFRQSFVVAEPDGPRAELLRQAGVELLCLPRRGALDLRYAAQVNAWLRRERPQITNTRGISAGVWWQVLARGLHPRPASIVTRSAFEVAASPLTRHLADWQLQLADRVVCNSSELVEHLKTETRGRVQPRLIENGVDFEAIEAGPVDRRAVRLASGLHSEIPLIISHGRLHSVKQLELLVAAAAILRAEGLLTQYLLLGDGPEAPRLREAIVSAGLQNCFQLLPGRSAVGELLAAADIFVLCSRSESTSNSLLEAAGLGLPCISTPVPGSRRALGAGAYGILLDRAAGPREIAAAIRRYVESPELAAVHGRAARAAVRSSYSLQAMVSAYAALFEEAAAECGWS